MTRTCITRALVLAGAASVLLVLGACERPGAERASSGAGSAAQSGTGTGTAQAVDDTAITAAVKARLVTEPELKVLQISVDTANGVVRLSGSVDSAPSVQKAAQVAGGIRGVKAVDNRLVVNAKG
jgi:osmotically-inducible protein OsmY